MLVNIPTNIAQMALDAHVLQNTGSEKSLDVRQLQVERMEKYIWEIVSAIILKEYNDRVKRLPK